MRCLLNASSAANQFPVEDYMACLLSGGFRDFNWNGYTHLKSLLENAEFSTHSIHDRRKFPAKPGIYIVASGSDLLYVGQTNNLRTRWAGHHRLQDVLNIDPKARLSFVSTPCYDQRLFLEVEKYFIQAFSPLLNGGKYKGGRPKKGDLLPGKTVRFEKESYEAFDKLAKELGKNTGDLIREVLKKVVNQGLLDSLLESSQSVAIGQPEPAQPQIQAELSELKSIKDLSEQLASQQEQIDLLMSQQVKFAKRFEEKLSQQQEVISQLQNKVILSSNAASQSVLSPAKGVAVKRSRQMSDTFSLPSDNQLRAEYAELTELPPELDFLDPPYTKSFEDFKTDRVRECLMQVLNRQNDLSSSCGSNGQILLVEAPRPKSTPLDHNCLEEVTLSFGIDLAKLVKG